MFRSSKRVFGLIAICFVTVLGLGRSAMAFGEQGACCVQGNGEFSCLELDEADCGDMAPSVYIGDENCAEVSCGGACCLDDGKVIFCDLSFSADDCTKDFGGTFIPDARCAEEPCPTGGAAGACCVPDGMMLVCIETTSETDCFGDLGGILFSLKFACEEDPCPNEAALIECPPNVIVECGDSVDPTVTGTPICTGTLTSSDSFAPGCGAAGVITRTWTCTATTAESASCDQIITIVDTTNPIIECPADITIECGEDLSPWNTGFATSTDNCDSHPGVTFQDLGGGSCPDGYMILRVWEAFDECGNSIDCSQLITVLQFAHPGWNHVSAEITLTKNEPAYWSVASGQPKGVAPFTVLDPAGLPTGIAGRPDPDGSGDWILRGYVIGWAVDSNNEEIRWNHLKGDAIIVNYDDPSAWEYNAWAFPVVANVGHGDSTGTPGELNLDGSEYAPGFDQLLLDFYAPGSDPFGGSMIEADLTLFPISVDLRQEDNGPVTTKAKIDIWNENEVKFNGTERCITCWDQTLLSNYTAIGVPNSFLYGNLQTNKGKARIDGIRSDNCDFDYEFDPDVPFGDDPRDIVSQDASMLGVSAKFIRFMGVADGVAGQLAFDQGYDMRAGMNLFGMGSESATIQYDTLGAPPEAAGNDVDDMLQQLIGQSLRRSDRRGPVGSTEGVASSVDRVSGSEKGSLLIWSKVEVRWDKDGKLIQDTFIDVSNDFAEDVMFQMYFINGDAALEESPLMDY